MKPLMFKIEETFEKDIDKHFAITFFYEDGAVETIALGFKPMGLELNKPYSIEDICGYAVMMNNKGEVEII